VFAAHHQADNHFMGMTGVRPRLSRGSCVFSCLGLDGAKNSANRPRVDNLAQPIVQPFVSGQHPGQRVP